MSPSTRTTTGDLIMLALAKMTARSGAATTLGRRCLGTKIATGLVGLPVAEDGVGDLAAVSEAILKEVQVRRGRESHERRKRSFFVCVCVCVFF